LGLIFFVEARREGNIENSAVATPRFCLPPGSARPTRHNAIPIPLRQSIKRSQLPRFGLLAVRGAVEIVKTV
jgi:hypothetical protein